MSQEKKETCMLGKQSIELNHPVFIRASASVVGTKEGQGPLAELFDMIGQDDMFGCASWEEAESSLQKDAVYLALGKAGMKKEDIRYLFAGDLLGQSIASSFGLASYEIPLVGLYGACSTCGLSLSMGAMAWYVSLPATLPVRKRSSVSLWDMGTKGRCPHLGR